MAFTVDYTTSVGKVRALIGDVDATIPFLEDEAITALLGLEDGSVKRAAANCLRAMASKHVLILKKIETLDLKTDAPAMAKAMMELAQTYERQAKAEIGIEFGEVIAKPLAWTALVYGLPEEATSWASEW